MTQIQRRNVAYGCACGSVALSFLAWTAFLTAALSLPPEETTVRVSVTVVPLETEPQLPEPPGTSPELTHGAARASVLSVPSTIPDSVIGEPVLPQEAEAQGQDAEAEGSESQESELVQWELSDAYSISIPSLGIRAPVLLPSMRFWKSRDWKLLEEQMQMGLNYGAVAYPHSAVPGEKGSVIIAGHSSPPTERAAESEFGRLFAEVPSLKPGDIITISRGGKEAHYEVRESVVVPPTATEILRQQSEKGEIKLITCYPVGSTRDRIVVTAELLM